MLCRISGDAVKFRAPIVFGGAFGGADPFALDQAMERGVERALLDLQNFVGAEFDGFGDGVSVGTTRNECLEDQKIERASQQLDLAWRIASHSVGSLLHIV